MDITVCICTHDRPDYVRDCLAGLRAQTVAADRFDTLIVDSASSEPAAAILATLARDHGATLIRVDHPGVSLARNSGAKAAHTPYIAYIDDDAIPAADWIAAIQCALAEPGPAPAVLGGRILPRWEAPLPAWWPPSLLGVLSIIEYEGRGEYRSPQVPAKLEPYAANMVVSVAALRAVGGFPTTAGRYGTVLLSDEEVQLAWTLQNMGRSVRYDSRIVVRHQIQASRFTPKWLLSRLYWQGASTVVTRRLTGRPAAIWREVPRRCLVALLFAPFRLVPARSVRWLEARWRLAYATGFLRAALGWQAWCAAQALATRHQSATAGDAR